MRKDYIKYCIQFTRNELEFVRSLENKMAYYDQMEKDLMDELKYYEEELKKC